MEKNDVLVSVVILTYNDAPFIEETLNSVKDQTYKNIELVVSDDCSTDDTVERCSRWLEQNRSRFTNVQLLTVEKNTGVTYNINRAQRAARGEWIKGLGGDDLLTPDCIEVFMNFVNSNSDIKIVQCGLAKINENNDFLGYDSKGFNKYFHSEKIPAYWQHQFLLRKDPLEAMGLFKSKELLEKVDYYDCEFPMQEDVAFAMKVVSSGYKIWFIDNYLIKRRMRAGTLSGLSDTTLVNRNNMIRVNINKKYFVPQLGWLEGKLLLYYDKIHEMFFNHPKLNKKSSYLCRMLKHILQSPYILIRQYKLRQVRKNICKILQD
ncbi:MAG: glycosyltransferase [Tidjanibacter sp.]|nr:glycosyltransferase [Tidjanibacter sp.]